MVGETQSQGCEQFIMAKGQCGRYEVAGHIASTVKPGGMNADTQFAFHLYSAQNSSPGDGSVTLRAALLASVKSFWKNP